MKIKYTPATDYAHTPRFELDSGCREYPGCHLSIATRRHRIDISLPQVIKPWRRWVDTSAWSKDPKAGYWGEHPRRYGAYLHNNHFYVSLGAQTMDSTTTQKWSCFLPWGEWRHVRFSLYGPDGGHFWTQLDQDIRGSDKFMAQHAMEKEIKKVSFNFEDYDGEVIVAETHIEERQWKRGTGWFKWLSWFYEDKVRRSLDIHFSKEVGRRKGSWKGGTIGHSIDLLPGELHAAAFQRYCDANGLTLLEELE